MLDPAQFIFRQRVLAGHAIDGDTVVLDLDLGFHVNMASIRARLLGINAPEMHGVTAAAGVRSRDALQAYLDGHTQIVSTTYRSRQEDHFGRWLAVLWVWQTSTRTWVNVNDGLVANGFAVPYMVDQKQFPIVAPC